MRGTIQPTLYDCKICIDFAESCGVFPDCKKCHKKKEVEVLTFTSSFWGDKAICKSEDNKVFSISISDIEINE